jgi:hypothetical protein
VGVSIPTYPIRIVDGLEPCQPKYIPYHESIVIDKFKAHATMKLQFIL